MAASSSLLLQIPPSFNSLHNPPLENNNNNNTKMKLINGVNVFLFLFLALSSLFSSANAICVPRNISQTLPPVLAPIQQSPTSEQPLMSTPPATTIPANELTGVRDKSDINLNKLHSELESSTSSSPEPELVEICDVTSNPQLCKNSISSHIEGTTVDPATALKTEIQQSIKEVQKAVATLNALIKDSGATHAEVECYDTCLENFEIAIDDLKSGLEAIDAGDSGRMESVLTAVMTDLTTCDDTFVEMGVNSPLDNLSAKMSKYASNCLAISKLLL